MDYGGTDESRWSSSMAVNKDSKERSMQDFWSKYSLRMYISFAAIQYAFLLALFGILELLQITSLGLSTYLIISIISATVLNIIVASLLYAQTQPFRDLVRAVILASGETPTKTPPDPSTYSHNKDGFSEILQSVYTLRKSSEDTLLNDIKDISPGIVMLNKNNDIIYSNDSAPVAKDMDEGLSLDLHFPEKDSLEQWLQKVKKGKLKAEKQWGRISNKLPGEKDRRIFDVSASFRKDSTAEVVLVLLDRTDLYAPEEDELEFISFAAHELRGPITVIRGYLDVLQDELHPRITTDQQELMSRLVVSANRLTSYVNNILNASRYDRRHLKLHLVEEKPKQLYSLVADDMRMRASTQNRLLAIDIPDNLPTVAADVNAVGEVLSNLIDNAIKYSNEGGLVRVTAKTAPGFVEISVIDRGIGMPENVLPNLFHKFYRSHRSRETVAGTGIGLYICKAIISSHGGTITARSVQDEGSTFSFTLPIYDTVAEKIKPGNNNNKLLIEHGSGWIRNHSLYRG